MNDPIDSKVISLDGGYSFVVVAASDGQRIASLRKNNGKTILWIGLLEDLKRVVDIRRREMMH